MSASVAKLQAQLNHVMQACPFTRFLNLEVTACDSQAGRVEMRMPMRPELARAEGSGQYHGGVIASLIDTAGCLALAAMQPRAIPTINLRTDYLRPAIDTSLRAVATVRRVGKTVGVVDIDIFDDAERLVAIGRGSFGTLTSPEEGAKQ